MKKILLILAVLFTINVHAQDTVKIYSINTFIQLQEIEGTVRATTPIAVQYAIKYDITNTFIAFAAAGFGHNFNGDGLVINNATSIAGIAVKIKNVYPFTIGIGAGANWLPKPQFIVGVNTDIELSEVTKLFTARTSKSKKIKTKASIVI